MRCPLYVLVWLFAVAQPGLSQASQPDFFCSGQFQHILVQTASKVDYQRFPQPQQLSAWLALIDIVRDKNFCKPDSQPKSSRRLQQWMRQFPQHPARKLFPALFAGTEHNLTSRHDEHKRIAVLLPKDEKYRPYSEYLFQHLEQRLPHPQFSLDWLDSNKIHNLASVQNDGKNYHCVIGPLKKINIRRVSQFFWQIPVLSLQHVSNIPIASSLFFSLSRIHENDIQYLLKQLQVAAFAHGILIYEQESRLMRTAAADLQQGFEQQFGTWVAVSSYSSTQKIVQQQQFIRQLLGIEQSLQRHKKLSERLGIAMQFIPRGRQDMDFIVLFTPVDGIATLYPQIRYWLGTAIAVFGHSSVYFSLNQLDRFDRQGLKVYPPRWFSEQPQILGQTAENINQTTRMKLQQIARDAARLIRQSHCLELEYLFGNDATTNNHWKFRPQDGIFYFQQGSR